MTTYWCSWCGATAQRPSPNMAVACRRCIVETLRIFGFWPRALMAPLRSGEIPPPPSGAVRRFEFRDVRSGQVVDRTDLITPTPRLRPIPL